MTADEGEPTAETEDAAEESTATGTESVPEDGATTDAVTPAGVHTTADSVTAAEGENTAPDTAEDSTGVPARGDEDDALADALVSMDDGDGNEPTEQLPPPVRQLIFGLSV